MSIFNSSLIRNAVLMMFIVASLTACKNDVPTKEVQAQEPVFESDEYTVPTEDALAVVSELPAYVFAYNYTNFGAALVSRMQNRVAVVNEDTVEDLATVILHNSQITSMTEEGWQVILFQLLTGRNIIIIEPTLENFKHLCNAITAIYIAMNELEEGKELLAELDVIPGVRQTLEAFYDMSTIPSKVESMFMLDTDSRGVFAEALAVRGCDFHVVERVSTAAESEIYHEKVVDEEGSIESFDNTEVDNSVTEETVSPYTYGLFADMFTEWINEQDYYVDIREQMLDSAIESLGSRATETNKYNLEDICNVQRVQYTMSAHTPYYVGPKLPVTVSFEICSVYMENEDCDYYCVYKKILAYNQVLDCGPLGEDNKRKWRQSKNFQYENLFAENAKDRWVSYKYYGPYMRDIEGRSICHTHTSDFIDSTTDVVTLRDSESVESVAGVVVEQASPKNSIGSIDKTDGFSFGFDGGLCLAKDPSVNLGFSMSWDTSTTQTIDDLEIIASTANGVPEWKYVGHNLPEAYYNMILECSHSDAPTIMRRECEVDQSWIWRVPNPQGSYRLYDETKVTTSLMYFTTSFFQAYANYVNSESIRRVSFLMMPPPRCQQRWMMNVYPHSDELNAMIATTHSRYWKEDDHEFAMNDVTEDSRVSIEQFINDFQRDLNNKRYTWKNRNFKGTYTFSYYKVGSENEEPITFDFVVE